jgi:hypothetical protein
VSQHKEGGSRKHYCGFECRLVDLVMPQRPPPKLPAGKGTARAALTGYLIPTSNSESHHLPSRAPKFISFCDSDLDVGMGLGLQHSHASHYGIHFLS